MGERPENNIPRLGDILNGRYHIFRKLGAGSQSTVWLAADKRTTPRRFVAIKVHKVQNAELNATQHKFHEPVPSSVHPGRFHVEQALDEFTIQGQNEGQYCKVVEPLGLPLDSVLEIAFEKRAKLNQPESWLGKVLEGDCWSVHFAKRACYQILLGLDYLHEQRIAHRDVHPGNICLGLNYNLSLLSENEIQRAVWSGAEDEKAEAGQGEEQTDLQDGSSSSDSSESSDESDESWREWKKELEQRKIALENRWKAFDRGDQLATPFSSEWNKANFFNSRKDIALLEQSDSEPLKLDEVHYTMASRPLDNDVRIEQINDPETPTRFVLVDLGFSCPFDECEQRTLYNLADFRPPEALLNVPVTYKGDIFSAGLLLWEIVMLRRLVEARYFTNDSGRIQQKNRSLRDLVQRLGPLPASMRAQWRDAEDYINADGGARDMQEQDEETYGPDSFEYGDIWHQARNRKPLDMSVHDLDGFMDLVQCMMRWEPEMRPSTADLLQHEWFEDVKYLPTHSLNQ